MDLRFGFSWVALLCFALVMLPNVLYFLYPPVNVVESSENVVVNLLDQGSKVIFAALSVMLISRYPVNVASPYLLPMVILLLLYYVCWIRYFAGGREFLSLNHKLWFIPTPMAILPVLFFMGEAIWLHNIPAALTMIFCGIVHGIGSYGTFGR